MKRLGMRKKSGSRRSALPPAVRDEARELPLRDDGPARPDTGHPSPDDEVLFHLSSLLDSVKTGIISLDGEGRVRVFNAVAETIFSLSRRSVLGRPFSELDRRIGPADHSLTALWQRLSDAVWAAGAALDLEYDLLRPQGQKRTISYSVYPLGQMVWSVGNGVVIMLEDVTRKRELEDQITDGRKRLQAVFDGITDGIQVVDREFRVTAVNKSMNRLLGSVVVIGQRCYRACSSSGEVCERCPAAETFRSGQPASIIKRVVRRVGPRGEPDEQMLEISTFPLLDRANRVPQVVEYIKDVTERSRLAERLEHARRLAEIGEMAARVAHEVRNPLNAITGAAHFLEAEYRDDETVQKFTSLIKRQSLRVDQVASDILHAAKPPRPDRTSVAIDEVLDQTLVSLGAMIEEQGISVERSSDPGVPLIQADELQIEQAIYNVLKNAAEAMPGGGWLRVATVWDKTEGQVRLSIEDTGPGIQPADRERIFRAFFTTKRQGTGLGLSIVEGVLKNHGGTIMVDQPRDRGARITLSFPVRERRRVPRESSEHRPAPPEPVKDQADARPFQPSKRKP
jgi:PAS domain S-box-containing protein